MPESFIVDKKLIFNRKGQKIIRLRNNSGGSVAAGSVVIYDTTTTDAFTTTTTQNDPLVAGVCLGTIANQGMGEILQEGFTDLLKVDGTTDIAAGDFLTSYTTAGIGAKRSANTSAGQFALALEAYTTNDGNGVIDAWIFAPNRVAGATSSWGDGTLLQLGTDNDIALLLRATSLAADTILAGVVEGTADTLATAANSLMIANVTDDGDVHIVASKAGNSYTAFLAQGATGDTILNAPSGQSVDFYVAGTKEYDLSATILDLNGNHLDNSGYLILNAVTNPAGTEVYASHDNAGDLTLNALTGKTVNLAVAGTDVVNVAGASVTLAQQLVVSSGGADITGNVTISGSLTYGGNWTVAATLTADELILDTDGDAANVAATAVGLFRDNAGDGTLNIVAGKTFNISHANTDEYTFSSTVADFLDNAIDNAGYLILNAATAPAGTEVYAVNDNTGDLTLNALAAKDVIIAIAGVDEAKFDDAAHIFNDASNDRDFRVETADLAYALYLDGAKNAAVLMGNTDLSDVNSLIRVGRLARTATDATAYYDLYMAAAGAVTTTGVTAVVATVRLDEPNITVGGGSVTNAATLYIAGAPTEGGVNSAIMLAAGNMDIGADDAVLRIGAAQDVQLDWSTADASNHAAVLKLGASNALHICADGDEATDWNVSAYTDPILLLHSDTTPATNYMRIWQSSTTGYVDVVSGTAAFQLHVNSVAELTVNATVVNVEANTLAGSTAAHSADTADGSLYLQSTSNATKGFVCIANADLGLVVGSDGSVDRATTVGTNAIHLFNGTAPAGTLANGVSVYSTGGECYIMDAGGTATLQTQHSADGDFVHYGYSAVKDKTVVIHLEKFLRALATKFPGEFDAFLEENPGLVHKNERAARGLSRV